MPIIGFNFDKISVERKVKVIEKLKISNSMNIVSVTKEDLSLGKEKKVGLKLDFEFKTNYEPKVGDLMINGHVLFYDELKKINEMAASWSKNKKLPQEVTNPIINHIFTRCNITALSLLQQINLPPHIPLPRLRAQPDSGNYIG